ncbi:MAG: hypothetical protein U1F98_07600 [Verrucomicrobiota bacterium]
MDPMIADSQPVNLDLESRDSSGRGEPSARPDLYSALRHHLVQFFESLVPLGYEDNTGFHYGQP